MTWTIAPSESFDLPASFAPAPRASTALPSTPTGTSFLAPPAALGDDEQVRAPAASVSAPISSPRLTLSGTIGGTSASTIGFAIISSSEQGARLYRVGEAIDGAPAVTVQMIEADRVTLNHGGTLETLWLSATSDE